LLIAGTRKNSPCAPARIFLNSSMTLPDLTVELVNTEAEKFDHENQLTEQAITQLVHKFPNNTDPSHVLLKVVVVNDLYGAGLPRKHIEPVTHHITALRIDEALAAGKPSVVDDIINCAKLKEKYFSFASKFCSWHNPGAYPIYDRNVDECLWHYNGRYHFTTYNRGNYSYVQFVGIVSALRNFFHLNEVTFKQLDKALWHLGDQLLSEKNTKAGL